MELLEQAESGNDFGLRATFPWTGANQRENWLTIVSDPEERKYVEKLIDTTGRSIKRVENPYLWARYVLQCEELNANRRRSTRNAVEERIVIHGTTWSNAIKIADENFDWRLVRRSRFGLGTSFSPNVTHVDEYAKSSESYIIAGILIGDKIEGDLELPIPPAGYDTTTDLQWYRNVLVKYYDNDFYPYYLVEPKAQK